MPDHSRLRREALMHLFDEETAADFDAIRLHRHGVRTLGLHDLVQEFRDAGLITQAEELLRRINEMGLESMPARPLPPAVHQIDAPSASGAAQPPLPRPRRGRPPKPHDGGPTS